MRNKSVSFLAFVLAIAGWASADVTLAADDNDGHDNCWQKRYDCGKNTWGIEGNHRITSGKMWFNSFPGASGTYQVKLSICAEEDGRPAYRVYAGGSKIADGRYPWPNGQSCAGASTKGMVLDLGEHHISNGEKIELWGQSTYECSESHGAYTRWDKLIFKAVSTEPQPPSINLGTSSLSFSADEGYSSVSSKNVTASNGGDGTLPSLSASESADWLEVSVSGTGNSQTIKNEIVKTGMGINTYSTTVTVSGSGVSNKTYTVNFTVRAPNTNTPTKIVSPAAGTDLEEGKSYTLSGEGDNLHWAYDANSDGLGEIAIGSGATVDFTIPDDIKDPKEITIKLMGDNGNVSETYQIVAASAPTALVTVLEPNGNETYTVGEEVTIRWETDTNVITDVQIFLSTDNGKSWTLLNTESSISQSTSEWSNFKWTPTSEQVSDQCLLRIEQYEASEDSQRDWSDATFTVEAASTTEFDRRHRRPGTMERAVRVRADGVVELTFAEPGRHSVAIVDARGAVVLSRLVEGPAGSFSTASLSPGVYLLRLSTKGRDATPVRLTVR